MPMCLPILIIVVVDYYVAAAVSCFRNSACSCQNFFGLIVLSAVRTCIWIWSMCFLRFVLTYCPDGFFFILVWCLLRIVFFINVKVPLIL